jgi:hypothetical protein
MGKRTISHKWKIIRLLEFHDKHKDEPSQAAKSCPFSLEYGKVSCYDLCLSFERLQNEEHKCPCIAFGYEEAMTRLRIVLDEAEWEAEHE